MAGITREEYWQLREKLSNLNVVQQTRLISDTIQKCATPEIKQMTAELDKIKGIGPIMALEILFSMGMLIIEKELE